MDSLEVLSERSNTKVLDKAEVKKDIKASGSSFHTYLVQNTPQYGFSISRPSQRFSEVLPSQRTPFKYGSPIKGSKTKSCSAIDRHILKFSPAKPLPRCSLSDKKSGSIKRTLLAWLEKTPKSASSASTGRGVKRKLLSDDSPGRDPLAPIENKRCCITSHFKKLSS